MRLLEPPARPMTGVGGWLAFFVLTCFYGVLYLPRSLEHAHGATVVCNVLGVVLGIVSAILILRRNVTALHFVAATLATRLLAAGVIGYNDSLLHRLAHPALILGLLIYNIAANTIWFVYFRTSKRVHNTFGRNL